MFRRISSRLNYTITVLSIIIIIIVVVINSLFLLMLSDAAFFFFCEVFHWNSLTVKQTVNHNELLLCKEVASWFEKLYSGSF